MIKKRITVYTEDFQRD